MRRTSVDFESDIRSDEVRSIIKIYISRDGEGAVEEGIVRVGDRNTREVVSAILLSQTIRYEDNEKNSLDRVRISTASRPRNIISRELNPIQAVARPTNRNSYTTSPKRISDVGRPKSLNEN